VVNSLNTDTQQGGRKSACAKICFEKAGELSFRFTFIGLALATDLRGVLRGVSNDECGERWNNPNKEEIAPGHFKWEYGIKRQVRGGRNRPANGVAALHNRQRSSALFRPCVFSNQRGTDGPLAAEEESFEGAPQEEVECVLRCRR